MFIKKDSRKVSEILSDESDPRTHLKLARRGAEFASGLSPLLCHERHLPALQALQTLSLYGNSLSDVTGIGVLKGTPVREINLGQNLLETLPEELGEIRSLERLWLDGNRIGPQLPQCLLELSQLRVLRASNNQIAELPEAIGHALPQLEVLAVDNNRLERLPESIWAMSRMEKLIVRGNHLEEISEEVGRLGELRMVQASSNRLQVIPEAMGRLAKLEELYLNGNQIAEVPVTLTGLAAVKKISLANNRIVALPAVLEEKWKLDGAPGDGPADAVVADEPAVAVELFGNPLGQKEQVKGQEASSGAVADAVDAASASGSSDMVTPKSASMLEQGNKRQKKGAAEEA